MGNGNGCTLRKFQRNLYFYGKLMTVRDFQLEQDYLNGKRHLINRLVLGSGVACGLEVTATFDAAAKKVNLAIAKGVAIDCGGREIVVEQGENLSFDPAAADAAYCLWLDRTDCGIEPAPCPVTDTGNVCGETCCPSRMLECASFSVEKWTGPIPTADTAYAGTFTTTDTGGQADIRAIIKAHFARVTDECADCSDPCRVPVAFLIRKGATWNGAPDVIQNSVIHNNPELFEMLRRHLTDLGNPHLTTAAQVGALKSVDGVENPGGNVDLVPANAVTIVPDNSGKRVTIGESHSVRSDNPHSTTHEQTGPVAANPAGSDTTRNRHLADADAQRWNQSLTGLKVGAATVGNPGGAVTLVAGNNITISADAAAQNITFAAAGGGATPARTGRVTVETNADGIGSLRVDSGFDHANFSVQVGIDHGENVDYGSVGMYAGSLVFMLGRVQRQPQSLTGQFDIIVNGPQLGARSLPMRWVAIPAEPVATPTMPTATVTQPTFTMTMPSFTVFTPTFSATVMTPTFSATMMTPTFSATMVGPTGILATNVMATAATIGGIGSVVGPGGLAGPTIITRGRRKVAPPLTEVKGIGQASAEKLGAAGIRDAAALAGAKADAVAKALGIGDLDRAKRFIAEARRLTGKK